MNDMQIILAADHAGFALKESVKRFLETKKLRVLDVGSHELTPEDDYPVYMSAAAMKVAQDMSGKTRAIIFGGSGQGEAMVANRFPGVRAAVYYGKPANSNPEHDLVKLSRQHNDSNVLSIGAWFVDASEAEKAVESWLATPFSGEEKYQRRIDQIDSIE